MARVCMYVLGDRLNETACKIKTFLEKEREIKYYHELEKTDYDLMPIGTAVLKAEEKARKKECKSWLFSSLYRILSWLSSPLYRILSLLGHGESSSSPSSCENVVHFKSMQDLINRLDDEADGKTAAAGEAAHVVKSRSVYEVVIILGHSNVFNFGPFDICDILEAILCHKPVIVALLGCCGASVRYGPTLMISQMNGLETIFGFYQRRIYEDELIQTSLVTGIQNYLRFSEKLNGVARRIIAKRSFVLAALELKFHPENSTERREHVIPDDPTIFANDSDDKSTAQLFLSTLGKKFSDENPIPLSCLRLALFHIYTFEESSDSGPSINNFIKDINQLEGNEIEKKCRCEIKKRCLDKLVEMVARFRLAHVSSETLTDLKDGKWQSVDHLQFFVALLHGYWGKNSFENVRACACYHLEEMRKEVDMCDSSSLQKYCLCAIGFCLFCENTYVSFELPSCYVIGLVLYSELGFTPPETINFDWLTGNGDLLWIDRFHACDEDHKYIKLFKEEIQDLTMSNYYEREIQKTKINNQYPYRLKDLRGALGALHCCLFRKDDPSIKQYDVKEFDNKTSRDKGRMSYFMPFQTDVVLHYKEMRVTSQCDNTPSICRCRFVYQYFPYRDGKCEGRLYFTDSHYGWDLIPEEQLNEWLKKHSKDKDKNVNLNEVSFYDKLNKVSDKRRIFDLQNAIKKGFPFVKIGKLIMEENDYNLSYL